MKKMMMIVLVLIAVSSFGCDAGMTFTTNGSLYYPNMETAKGGSFGDPGGRGKTPAIASGSVSNEASTSGFGKWRK